MIRTLHPIVLALLACANALVSSAADEPGFTTLFNGKDLTGWDGRPGFWSVKDGHIRGETTDSNPAPGNTFLIWRDGTLKNFELKLRYRILTGNNSGVQYRSRETGQWVVAGYQAEVENNLGKTGFLYHEAGRGWLTDVGDFMEIAPDGKLDVVGVVANPKAIHAAPYHTDNEWNEYHFICRGNHVVHHLNGFQTVELIDHHVDKADAKSTQQRCMEGVLALQLHGGGPMIVDYKDIRLKVLAENFGEARRLFNSVDLTGWKDSHRKWSVASLPEGTNSPRQTKPSGPLKVLKCAGGGASPLALTTPTTGSYVLRFQRRAAGDQKTGGDTVIKPVLGWQTWEVEVDDGKVAALRVNGAATEANLPIVGGGPALPSDAAAEYRNVVLIPINASR
ncbi:MAG: DUF1080 domain-containing protein [Verrucomicrobiales bacterium]